MLGTAALVSGLAHGLLMSGFAHHATRHLPRAGTTAHASERRLLVPLQPKAGVSAAEDRRGLPFCKGGQKHFIGQSRRPPHRARETSMLARDGSTITPTAAATALVLALVLAFAPMGDAKAVEAALNIPAVGTSELHALSDAPTEYDAFWISWPIWLIIWQSSMVIIWQDVQPPIELWLSMMIFWVVLVDPKLPSMDQIFWFYLIGIFYVCYSAIQQHD